MSAGPVCTISILDYKNETEVYSYERAFYRSFGHLKDEDRIWNIDHASRTIRAKIPYETQEVHIAKIGERVVAAAAINFGMDKPLQLEMEGFTINKSGNGFCEIVQIFCQVDIAGGKPLLQTLAGFMTQRLVEKKVTRLYGTCSEKLVKRYRTIGLAVIDELVYRAEKVFLLEMDVTKQRMVLDSQ